MSARYLSTRLATDWEGHPDRATRILKRILRFIPEANRSYEPKLRLVRKWLIAFPDGNLPEREIGLDADGIPVRSGPNEIDYGFWLDTNMTYEDFEGEPVTAEDFEQYWIRATQPRKPKAEP